MRISLVGSRDSPTARSSTACLPVLAALALVLYCSLLPHSTVAQAKPVRRVLILNEVGPSFPMIRLVDQGIRTALDNPPYKLEFYHEYMDTLWFPDSATQQEFQALFLHKYQSRRPDVIITVGPSPLRFMLETQGKFFPNVPVIFCVPNGLVPSAPAVDTDFTGVEADLAAGGTLEVALKLQPGTMHVAVVSGTSSYDKQQLALVKTQLKAFEGHLDISYLTELAMPALLTKLRGLPSHSVVLLAAIGQDAEGTRFNSSETGPLIAAAANAPVFSLSDVYMNHGEVGGALYSVNEQGKLAGGLALKILSGEKPQNLPIVKAPTTYLFDWRALQRWGLKESDLPLGSIVLNRQSTVWESYKTYFIGGIFLILVETLLIFGLVWQRARRREAEAQLALTFDAVRESERRFRLVSNTAPVLIWMSGPDKLYTYFNQPWLDFTGRPLEAELGNGWSEGVHPEDLKNCMDVYTRTFDLRESFKMKYRLRRHDGEYRWMLDIGVPRLNPDGSFAGYIGSCIDATESKLAEEALAGVGRRLIEAHEEERTWIARELHDDINQRIALLSVQLEQWAQHPTDSRAEFTDHVHQVRQQLFDLGKDVQALSHRLHSSKLEYLGIVSAANGFCKELSEQQKVEIDFSHSGIPRSLPKEISLCLFRVLQEALQNAVKHSGERHFRVDLQGTSSELQLTVNDLGVGFDQEVSMDRHGIGLISMRERLKLVSGEFSIESKPGGGTMIRARIPLMAEEHRAATAG